MKNILHIITLLLCLAPVNVAARTVAEKAAGEYAGNLYIAINEEITASTAANPSTIRMEAETDKTVRFTLPNFKYGSLNLGDIVLVGIPVSETDGTIRFGENAPQNLKLVGGAISANVYIDHTTSYVKDGEAFVDVKVSTKIVFSNMNINVRFQGKNSFYEADGAAQEVKGTYPGFLYSEEDREPNAASTMSNSALSVKDLSGTTVSLTFPNVMVGDMNIGSVTFGEVNVSKSTDGTYHFGLATTSVSIMGGFATATITLDSGRSIIDGKKARFFFTADFGGSIYYLQFTTEQMVEDITSAITGTYPGNLYISLGVPVTPDTERFGTASIVLESDGAASVRFTMPNFSLGEASLGDIVLRGVPVVKAGTDTYRFGKNAPQTVSLAGGAIVAQVNINPETSIIVGDSAAIDINVVSDGNPIYVHFNTGLLKPDPGVVTTDGPAKEVEGEYPGNLYLSLGAPITSSTPIFKEDRLYLAATTDTTVQLTLKDFSFGASPMGDIVLKDIPVFKDSRGRICVSQNAPQAISLASGSIQATASVTPTRSVVVGDSASIDVYVEWSGFPIYVHFDSGTIPEEPQIPAAEEAAGKYSGSLFISLGVPVGNDTQAFKSDYITLTQLTDTTVQVVLKDFSFGAAPMGDIVLTDIPVHREKGGTIRFGENVPQTVSLADGSIVAEASVDHTKSYVRNGQADIYVNVAWSSFNIYVRFASLATGIETTLCRPAGKSERVFDLQGRPVGRMQRGRTYIVGGRKMIYR